MREKTCQKQKLTIFVGNTKIEKEDYFYEMGEVIMNLK